MYDHAAYKHIDIHVTFEQVRDHVSQAVLGGVVTWRVAKLVLSVGRHAPIEQQAKAVRLQVSHQSILNKPTRS